MASSLHPVIYRFSFTTPTTQTGLTTSLQTEKAKDMPNLSGDFARASLFLHKPLDADLQGDATHLAPHRVAVA
jgi:hypothetical protein